MLKPRGRNRPMVNFSMSPEAIEMLGYLATANALSKSAVVEALVRVAASKGMSEKSVEEARVRAAAATLAAVTAAGHAGFGVHRGHGSHCPSTCRKQVQK